MTNITANTVLLLIAAAFAVSGTARADNIAEGKTVAGYGEFFVGGWQNPEGLDSDWNSLTDGMFFPNWHRWDQGPVWWDESVPESADNYLTVFLGPETCYVTRLRIQVDNNDDYLVSWQDERSGTLESVSVIPLRNTGMAPPVNISVDACTKAFTIEHDDAGAGDGFYSVSEFQAFGYCLGRCPGL